MEIKLIGKEDKLHHLKTISDLKDNLHREIVHIWILKNEYNDKRQLDYSPQPL